ncbi:SH3 domain protein [Scheffersomyces xylosifermentans]|uniref:SH3 domain protein n=1 Tax=Scheffersomyces xylosifermentans TaxID=1304137 RepID=UPI00315D87A1
MSVYIGVYKALYEYAAQAEEELNLQPDDLLYLLERSDIDEWWKVKKRVLPQGDEEVDEPVGLVPSNYIEEAPVIKIATALYDYDKQTEDELSFKEGDTFNVYDLKDPDWILCGDASKQFFGFIPSNYIDLNGGSGQTPSVVQSVQPQAHVPISNFAPPPLHKDRTVSPEAEEPTYATPTRPAVSQSFSYEQSPQKQRGANSGEYGGYEDDAPPPMPSRPTVTLDKPVPDLPASARYEQEEDSPNGKNKSGQEHEFDGEYFTWYIDEVDGRKRRAIIFSVGQGMILVKPNSTNPKKLKLKSASTLDNQWRVRDLIDFSHEKKHVFLEFKNPKASLELHAGSKDVAEAIMSIIGDLKGAESAKGLKEVARASQATTSDKNRKIGRLLYDFEAQGDDELMIREGEEVYIINETKSKDWWMCENIDTGRQGVIPSSYIEIIGTSNLDKLTDGPQRRKSTKASSKSRSSEKAKSSSAHHRHRGRDEREQIRERDRIQRDKSKQEESSSGDKAMPNFHRVRTWIDSSGSFKVEAEFLGCVEGKIHLHKTNGVKIAVAATKLSIEDLEYVEKVTGTSLESYKEEVNKQMLKRSRSKSKSSGATNGGTSGVSATATPVANSTSVGKSHSATAAINDIPPPQPSRPKATTELSTTEPDYDWFEFFLQCGVDIGNCQRYTLNFNREQIDENILEDITPSLLRTLGLREGDILRVMKFLDNKFNRKKGTETPAPAGGLFIDTNGALRNNNSSTEVSKVNANALPSPLKTEQAAPQLQAQAPTPDNNLSIKKFEDDAWAVKPAARSTEDLLKPSSQPQTPQYTGSLQDLVKIKPLESNAGLNTGGNASSVAPSAPALTPVKTGTLIQPDQKFAVQKTGTSVAPQITGGFVPVQRTGLVPVTTGGFLPAQPTGFMPITAQPTGFLPIQATGILQPQLTFGITTFGQPVLSQITGPLPGQITGGLPPTSFNSQPIPLQRTGPSVPAQRTGGPIGGGFVPQSAFGQQITGGFMANPVNPPANTFSQQLTGGIPTTSFGQQTGGNAFNQFQGQQPPTSFGGQATGGYSQPSFAPQNGFQQQNGFNSFPQQQPQQQSFTPQNGFQQQTGFNSFPQQSPVFNQFQQQQQQPNMNQLTNMFQNTGINPAPTFNQQSQPFPNTSFGGSQPQFEGFAPQPLQNQPTGVGFGNAPLQSQPTGKRANLQAATPDNPFGF